MVNEIDDLIRDTKSLPAVPLKSATLYLENTPLMKRFVDNTLSSDPSINDLIGNNPLQVMYDNHTHHAAFMWTVFCTGSYELLARTVPWVYRAYSFHNFKYDYFTVELKAWLKALEKYLPDGAVREIKSVYNWMLRHHENMERLSKSELMFTLPVSEDWLEMKNSFMEATLEGNYRKCLNISKESVANCKDIEKFYLHIIQPVMYEVGMLWEKGTISVAQEHLASAIIGRVMASISITMIADNSVNKKAVISAVPNEYHEIGAWMVSDILEYEGWDVRYLGANTPVKDLLTLMRSFKPEILALSVTMPFNLLKAKEVISRVREDEEFRNVSVIIGGRVLNEVNELWSTTGADYFAANIQDLKNLVNNIGQ